MSYSEIKIIEKRIENLFVRIDTISKEKNQDDETISDLTKLLCVLISGLVEKKFVDIIKKYSEKRCSTEIRNYISNCLVGTTNLRLEKIEKILNDFCPDWRRKIKSAPDYDEYNLSLNYIISNRNVIAHGGNSGVTIRDLDANYRTIKNMIKDLEKIILKATS